MDQNELVVRSICRLSVVSLAQSFLMLFIGASVCLAFASDMLGLGNALEIVAPFAPIFIVSALVAFGIAGIVSAAITLNYFKKKL